MQTTFLGKTLLGALPLSFNNQNMQKSMQEKQAKI